MRNFRENISSHFYDEAFCENISSYFYNEAFCENVDTGWLICGISVNFPNNLPSSRLKESLSRIRVDEDLLSGEARGRQLESAVTAVAAVTAIAAACCDGDANRFRWTRLAAAILGVGGVLNQNWE